MHTLEAYTRSGYARSVFSKCMLAVCMLELCARSVCSKCFTMQSTAAAYRHAHCIINRRDDRSGEKVNVRFGYLQRSLINFGAKE